MPSTQDAIQGALNVVTDPCLGDVARLLHRLHELEQKPGEIPTPVEATPGIGLCKAVGPIKAVIFLREKPLVGAALIAGFLGIFVGIGYKYGRRKASKS